MNDKHNIPDTFLAGEKEFVRKAVYVCEPIFRLCNWSWHSEATAPTVEAHAAHVEALYYHCLQAFNNDQVLTATDGMYKVASCNSGRYLVRVARGYRRDGTQSSEEITVSLSVSSESDLF